MTAIEDGTERSRLSANNDVRGDDRLAQEVLLQQYRVHLVRLAVTPLLNRVVFLVTIGFVVVVNPWSESAMIASLLVATVIANIWLYEQRTLGKEATRLADGLARQSSDAWEDTYIRLQSDDRRYLYGSRLLQSRLIYYESVVWLTIIMVIAISRYFLSYAR